MQNKIFEFINGAAERWYLLDSFGIFCAQPLVFVMGLSALVLALFWWRTRHDGRLLGGGIAAVALAELCVNFLKFTIGEQRPFMVMPDVHVLVPPLTSHAFPSGHTTVAFAIAVSVWLVNRTWGRPFLIAALLVGLGRVFVGVHWPLDVVAGAVLGTVLAWLSTLLIKRSYKPHPELHA